jgi:DNA repair protein RecN (Recombination protein N)
LHVFRCRFLAGSPQLETHTFFRFFMLKQLSIKQFVIIDDLTLSFGTGLSVLTGETGAGKSILLDALGLILGDEADFEAVRYGSDVATVEAHFAPEPQHPVWNFLADNKIAKAEDIRIKRVLTKSMATDEATVNGVVVDAAFLKELGTQTAEIHGQFANQNILDPVRQLGFLDSYGNYRALLDGTRNAWNDMKNIEKQLEDERKFMAQTADERITLTKTVEQMKKLKIKPGEYATLDARHKELTKVKNIGEMLQSIQSQLVAGSGAERALIQANRLLEKGKHFDPEKLQVLEKHLTQSLQSSRDSVSELLNLLPDYDINTEELHAAGERLDKFRAIAEQYETPPEQIMELYERLTARLTRIQNAAQLIEQLEDKLMDAKREYNKNSQALSKARKEGAVKLSNAITAELPPLKLLQAEFLVEVGDLPNNLWGPSGINSVVFTARTNKGMPFASIAKTASGGELARMILALKVILQKVQATSTLIFDEVDTGIGGAAAAAVGQRLGLLAQDTQVLVITHSPQVASRGVRQMVVSKREVNNVTLTNVRLLTAEERVDELARMLAGATITKAALAAAQSLLDEAAEPIKLSYAPAPDNDTPIIPPEVAAGAMGGGSAAQSSA